MGLVCCFVFFQAEDGIRDATVTGVQTCALPILDMLISGCNLIVRILDFCELKAFSLVREHMYSHTVHPEHFSGSHETIFHLEASAFGLLPFLFILLS